MSAQFTWIKKVIGRVHGRNISLRCSTEETSSSSGSPWARNCWRLGAYPKELLCFACPVLIPWPPLLAAVGNKASSDLMRQMLCTCTYSAVIANALWVAQSSISICRYAGFLPWRYRGQDGYGLKWCDLLMQSKMVNLPGYFSKEKIIDLAFSGIPATVIMMMMVTATRQKGQQ